MLDGFLSEERDQSLMNVIEVITAQRIFILQNIAKKNFWPFLIPCKFLRKYLTFRPKMSRGTDNNDPE